MAAKLIQLALIKRDGGTQSRAELSEDIIAEYAEAMEENTKNPFPALQTVYDGQFYWLWDGFHRAAAAERVGWNEIECDVCQGTHRDAMLLSVGANADHGLRRTNADKRQAVQRLLCDDEWVQWSDRQIAAKCFVSDRLVNNMRQESGANRSHLGADGKTYPAPRKCPKCGARMKASDEHESCAICRGENHLASDGKGGGEPKGKIHVPGRPGQPIEQAERQSNPEDEGASVDFERPEPPERNDDLPDPDEDPTIPDGQFDIEGMKARLRRCIREQFLQCPEHLRQGFLDTLAGIWETLGGHQ
jgi:uncharacterized ParB-like nuclease family protein